MNRKLVISTVSLIILIALVLGGVFIYNRRSQEAFGQSYNQMNADYKSVLFASGQNKNETSLLMVGYKDSFNLFYERYSTSPITPYNKDKEWKNSLDQVREVIMNSEILIFQNKSKDAHLELEKVRQIWQETFKRNGVTMLGFYLTEFHDIMEKAIEESDKRDFEKLDKICLDMNAAWNEVTTTQTEFSLDVDYKDKMGEETKTLASFCDAVTKRSDDVKELSGKLKSGFIPFYLRYG